MSSRCSRGILASTRACRGWSCSISSRQPTSCNRRSVCCSSFVPGRSAGGRGCVRCDDAEEARRSSISEHRQHSLFAPCSTRIDDEARSSDGRLVARDESLRTRIKGVLAATASTIPSDADYRTLVSITRPMLQAHFASAFKSTGVRAIVFPTTPIPPVPITQGPTISVRGNQLPFDPFFGRNVVPGSTTGLPGLVLPAGLTRDGLPVGIEFDGPAASDRALLGLGLSLERALGPIPAPKIA